MTDMIEDIGAQLSMMMKAYASLEKTNSDHGPLKLAKKHKDEGGFDWTPKLYDIFGKLALHAWAEYTFALESAANPNQPRYFQPHQLGALKKYTDYQELPPTNNQQTTTGPEENLRQWIMMKSLILIQKFSNSR